MGRGLLEGLTREDQVLKYYRKMNPKYYWFYEPTALSWSCQANHPGGKMKVQAGREYIFYPNLLDRIDGRTKLLPGDVVTVVNLPGCPRANTMGHAHVELKGEFA